MRIIKRDGREVEFDVNKITEAIKRANMAVCESDRLDDESIALVSVDVSNNVTENTHVEEIQDMVEEKLMECGKFALAKAYIIYRYNRALVRKSNTTDESIMSLIRRENKDLLEENSNKNPNIVSTQRDYIAGEVSRDLTRRLLLPEKISKAHDDGVLHFHDADYFIQPEFNCFSSGTKFVTDKGVKAFSDFEDGEYVGVMDKNGVWRKAVVRNYGVKKLYDVTLRSGRSTKTVVCTKNHRWVLSDGSVTTELSVGDTLYPLSSSVEQWEPQSTRDFEMFALGMVIGDGNDIKRGLHITLCGKKTVYENVFRKAGYRVSKAKNGYINANLSTKMSKQKFLTDKGWAYLTGRDKAMLFRGFYAADGSTDRNQVSTSDGRVLEFVYDVSAIAGYHISKTKEIIRDTNFKKGSKLYIVSFRTHQNNNNCWKVDSIVPHRKGNLEQSVWCVEEPVTHTFTLDGGVVTGNCCLVNIGDMLDNGTMINGKLIESPNSFQVACTVLTQIVACVASNQYGGQSVEMSHLGKYLRLTYEKYLRRTREAAPELDDATVEKIARARTKDELKSGVQTIQYQINTLMTTNGQSPFVTLFLVLRDNDPYMEENAAIIEEILSQRLEGIKNEKGVYITPAFPKLVYVLDECNCLKGGKYDYLTRLAVKCSAKRMYPDYISAKKMKETYEGNVFSPMGCRSFLSPWKDEEGNYKFEGRFNQGVVSINLPQIGIVSGGDEDKFWAELDERLELCYEALMCRHNALKGVRSDVSPIHWQYGAIARLEKGETIDKLLVGGYSTLSLGYIGLYELTRLVKGCSHTTPEGEEFALRVMRHLRETTDRWKKETGLGFALYGTPAESLCYRFARIDQEKYGTIKDVTDKGYYTNSYHVDVREHVDAFSKFAFESQFQKISSGGAISYVEVPNMRHNLEALEDVVRYIYDNIQYAEFNTKSDYCQVCGYDGEIQINDEGQWECPSCGNKDHNKMNVTRRTCGYLGENFWNVGKTKEIKSRVLHL